MRLRSVRIASLSASACGLGRAVDNRRTALRTVVLATSALCSSTRMTAAHRDRLFRFVPHVVIGHVRHRGIAYVVAMCQLRFGHGRHADDAAAPLGREDAAFAFGAKRGPSMVMNTPPWCTGLPVCCTVAKHTSLRKGRRGPPARHARPGHRRRAVGSSKKAKRAQMRAVEELIRHHDVAGGDPFLQGAAGRNGDQVLDAERLEAPDIGAKS